MNERLKQLRNSLGLTQQQFADRLGIKRGTIANYELGRNEPIDAVITLICEKFNISEDWLRYGKEPMEKPTNRDQEIENFMNEILRSESEDFRRRLINVLRRLDKKEWELLESMALKLAEELNQEKAQPRHNIIKIAGRDGSMEERALTDEELEEYQRKAAQLPDAGDDL